MAWPVPSGVGSCGNAIIPAGPALVYRFKCSTKLRKVQAFPNTMM